jgi:hypothetical protein
MIDGGMTPVDLKAMTSQHSLDTYGNCTSVRRNPVAHAGFG